MTDKKETVLDIDTTIMETSHKVESFYQNNKKNINTALIIIAGLVLTYLAYKYFYVEPKEKESESVAFHAQNWFAVDSFDLALNGQGDKMGFLAIADEYGMTKIGNLAHYYAGVCYLNKKDFQNAIDELEDFSTDSKILGPLREGLIGAAYSELGDFDKAASQYMKAAGMSKNKMTTPIYLKKAGLVYEELKEYSKAQKAYERIKMEYAESSEAMDIDKYIARAKMAAENN